MYTHPEQFNIQIFRQIWVMMIWCYVVVYSKSRFWRTCKPNLKLNINLLFEAHAKNDNWNHSNYLNPNVIFQSKLYTKYNAVKIWLNAVFQEQHHESLWCVRFCKTIALENYKNVKPHKTVDFIKSVFVHNLHEKSSHFIYKYV